MVRIKELDGGVLIDSKLLFASRMPHNDYINLGATMGYDMIYDKPDYKLIDYPGEYNIQDIGILCFVGKKKNLLSFIITLANGKKIGLIQTADVLKEEAVSEVDTWLYLDEKISNKLDQMELEGERIQISLGEELID